ncbi:MAG: hypothetical protein HC923_12905 [Myxococcales bacterium]|nr:hypothetical protein [Myxococcales bacterium]
MTTPLERLIHDPRTHRVGIEDVPFFMKGPRQMLFISGDPKLRPEAQDVAVVVRELTKGHEDIDVGWLAPEDEPEARKVLALRKIPCVIFAANGAELHRIEGMRDWEVYAQAMAEFLGRKETFK